MLFSFEINRSVRRCKHGVWFIPIHIPLEFGVICTTLTGLSPRIQESTLDSPTDWLIGFASLRRSHALIDIL